MTNVQASVGWFNRTIRLVPLFRWRWEVGSIWSYYTQALHLIWPPCLKCKNYNSFFTHRRNRTFPKGCDQKLGLGIFSVATVYLWVDITLEKSISQNLSVFLWLLQLWVARALRNAGVKPNIVEKINLNTKVRGVYLL